MAGTQGRNLDAGTEADYRGLLLTGLLHMVCLLLDTMRSYLPRGRTAHSGWRPPTSGMCMADQPTGKSVWK